MYHNISPFYAQYETYVIKSHVVFHTRPITLLLNVVTTCTVFSSAKLTRRINIAIEVERKHTPLHLFFIENLALK